MNNTMTTVAAANGARILVVDDVEDNRDLLVRRLAVLLFHGERVVAQVRAAERTLKA
jgi:CheY-like chemotaxis protein